MKTKDKFCSSWTFNQLFLLGGHMMGLRDRSAFIFLSRTQLYFWQISPLLHHRSWPKQRTLHPVGPPEKLKFPRMIGLYYIELQFSLKDFMGICLFLIPVSPFSQWKHPKPHSGIVWPPLDFMQTLVPCHPQTWLLLVGLEEFQEKHSFLQSSPYGRETGQDFSGARKLPREWWSQPSLGKFPTVWQQSSWLSCAQWERFQDLTLAFEVCAPSQPSSFPEFVLNFLASHPWNLVKRETTAHLHSSSASAVLPATFTPPRVWSFEKQTMGHGHWILRGASWIWFQSKGQSLVQKRFMSQMQEKLLSAVSSTMGWLIFTTDIPHKKMWYFCFTAQWTPRLAFLPQFLPNSPGLGQWKLFGFWPLPVFRLRIPYTILTFPKQKHCSIFYQDVRPWKMRMYWGRKNWGQELGWNVLVMEHSNPVSMSSW